MKILAFAGSLRKDSANKKYAREAVRLAQEAGATADFIDLRDYPMPPYDGDIEAAGIPETVTTLSKKIAEYDAVIISTPEYNASIPGMLKNVIDWLSRAKPVTLDGKHLLLLAASPGAFGGIRVLWHARQPFEQINVHVFPTMLGLPDAYNAFDENGQLKDDKKLKELIGKFINHVRK